MISCGVFVFAKELMMIFIHPQEVQIIQQGIQYLQIEGICYLGIGCLFLLYGYYRGVGKPGISVILTVISLGTRVLLAYLFAPTLGTSCDLVGYSYWLVSSRYHRYSLWHQKRKMVSNTTN